ncbi:hypothetical protein M422DRAFT_255284 [Sphaerobolus stellatus SS14]|uniref:Uncharacterized protein n=1 Tax=Sphaerobolus stellatus (strain SS14) TaxID=990650 RepID=A0A0C9V424_SPHS4|nr:hypothetical protein M422DRAFT_255284 [Sphaerobolus stellatus SS14]
MLSNHSLDNAGAFSVVPMETLVIDEASQINAFEYRHLFAKFEDLKKVCFFGDPNQLPPYGAEKVEAMSSIFDIKHIQEQVFFLNIQCRSSLAAFEPSLTYLITDRMPTPIGQFISTYVYGGRLLSQHKVHSKKCLAFIHADGIEESSGKSRRVSAFLRVIQ